MVNITNDNYLKKDPKIVVIGGGTGSSILLKGLKNYTREITAIVTVADDGGGSGVLREDLGMLPPGDIRSCLIALANTEPTMEKLMQYRFTGGCLNGQSFGNLFLAAMNGIYGSFELAVKEASNVLAITGTVYPMTLENVSLRAELENGEKVIGESNIPIVAKKMNQRIDRMFIEPQIAYPLEEGLKAIDEADLIVLGPGSLYTSVIPNLLVRDIPERIHRSRAKKVYISNVMSQPGETDGFNVLDHVEALLKHSRPDLIDYIIVNRESVPEDVLGRYETDDSKPIIFDEEQRIALEQMNIRVIEDDLIDVEKDYIKHDNDRLSEIIVNLAKEK